MNLLIITFLTSTRIGVKILCYNCEKTARPKQGQQLHRPHSPGQRQFADILRKLFPCTFAVLAAWRGISVRGFGGTRVDLDPTMCHTACVHETITIRPTVPKAELKRKAGGNLNKWINGLIEQALGERTLDLGRTFPTGAAQSPLSCR